MVSGALRVLTPSDGLVPGAVVAIAKDGKLAYLQAIGFQDRAKTIPMKTEFHLLDCFNVQAGDQRRRNDPGRGRQARPRRARRPISARASRHAGRGRKGRSGLWQDRIRARSSETPDDDSRSSAPYLRPHLSGAGFFRRNLAISGFGRSICFTVGRPCSDATKRWRISFPVWPACRSPINPARSLNIAGASTCWPGSSKWFPVRPSTHFCRAASSRRCIWSTPASMCQKRSWTALSILPMPERPAIWDLATPPKLFSGGGGLGSTAPDYLRFCQMMLNGGELDGVRLLTPQAVKEMMTNALPPDVRFFGNDVGPNAGTSFGLGFAIRTDPVSSRCLERSEAFPGAGSGARTSGLIRRRN